MSAFLALPVLLVGVAVGVPGAAGESAPVQASSSAAAGSAVRGRALPLRFRTHNATRVITVTARSHRSTTARLQAWTKASGGGWLERGKAVIAHVGSDGVSRHASEGRGATPVGSFKLLRAFGRKADPGTRLSYFRTRPSDWWISQAGSLYNTHQRCSSGCQFRQGSPNEHLYYTTPYYNYAVVIEYNTRYSRTGVVPGAGSAFFLHVHPAGTGPTAGCVAIGQPKLVRLMRWLRPAAHPRILIGVG